MWFRVFFERFGLRNHHNRETGKCFGRLKNSHASHKNTSQLFRTGKIISRFVRADQNTRPNKWREYVSTILFSALWRSCRKAKWASAPGPQSSGGLGVPWTIFRCFQRPLRPSCRTTNPLPLCSVLCYHLPTPVSIIFSTLYNSTRAC